MNNSFYESLFAGSGGDKYVHNRAQIAQIHAKLTNNIYKFAPFLPRHAITPVQNNVKIIFTGLSLLFWRNLITI